MKDSDTPLHQMEDLIVSIFVNELQMPFISGVKSTDQLSSLGVASLEVIRLLSELEVKLKIWISDDHYIRCDSIRSIAQICLDIMNSGSKTPPPHEECQTDTHPVHALQTESKPDPIVITGYSAITPLGIACSSDANTDRDENDEMWTNLIQGKSCFQPIQHFNPLRAVGHLCGMISDDVCKLPEPGHPERLKELIATSIQLAMEASQLSKDHISKQRVALILGTTDVGGNAAKIAYSQYSQYHQQSPHSQDSHYSQDSQSINDRGAFNAFHAAEISKHLGLEVHPITLANASAASAVAVGYGRDLLLSGDYDLVIVAGGDGITESAFQGLFSLRTLAAEGCRPFHPERRGIRISESAGVFILERKSTALQRSAPILGEIPGYGASHISPNPARPDPQGIAHAIQRALTESGLSIQDIGYVNLHGAGTIHGDLAEIQGLESVFGETLRNIPLSSTKPSLGHCQGAAGILEALIVLLSIRRNIIPPTLGLENVDKDFSHLQLFHTAQAAPHLKHGISISCGLGGTNTVILISQYPEPIYKSNIYKDDLL